MDTSATITLILVLVFGIALIIGVSYLVKSNRQKAVESLIGALKDSDTYVRRKAAEALGDIGDVRAVEPLIAELALRDGSLTSNRDEVTKALGKIGAPAVEPLIAALKDSNSNVRAGAAGVLKQLGWQPPDIEIEVWFWVAGWEFDKCVKIGAPAVEPLIAALKDSYGDVSHQAAKALGLIGDARAVEPLIAALKVSYGDVSPEAAKALGLIGDARAVEPLIAALRHTRTNVRDTAAQALKKIQQGGASG